MFLLPFAWSDIMIFGISVVSKNLKEKRFKQLPFPRARLFSIGDFRARFNGRFTQENQSLSENDKPWQNLYAHQLVSYIKSKRNNRRSFFMFIVSSLIFTVLSNLR